MTILFYNVGAFLSLCTLKTFPSLLFQPHGLEEVTSTGQQKLYMSQAMV